MDPIVPPIALPETKAAPELRSPDAPSLEESPAARAADARLTQAIAALRSAVLPDKLVVRLDENAHRFVQTLADSDTSETLLKYPSESQLAYSRAVVAYMKAFQAK